MAYVKAMSRNVTVHVVHIVQVQKFSLCIQLSEKAEHIWLLGPMSILLPLETI